MAVQVDAADRHRAGALRHAQLAGEDDARADVLLEAATASAIPPLAWSPSPAA
jgi:hypothetical protein